MAVNKNNRKIAVKPNGPYTEQGYTSRFVPLQAGYAYLRDPRDGKTHHVMVNSERFNTLLEEFIQTIGKDRIVTELEGLSRRFPADGWSTALRRARDAG